MTIIGVDGPEETILSANNQGRIFKFVNMDKVVIEGITLKDGLTFGNDRLEELSLRKTLTFLPWRIQSFSKIALKALVAQLEYSLLIIHYLGT